MPHASNITKSIVLGLRTKYIDNVFENPPATAAHNTVLAFATLVEATQIGIFLLVSNCIKWPRKVGIVFNVGCHRHRSKWIDTMGLG
jgi:hypothetical protein